MTEPTRLTRLSANSERLHFHPRFEEEGNTLILKADVDDESAIPWGLWGAVIAIAFAMVMLILEGMDSFRSLWMIALSAIFVGLGAVTARFGPRTTLRTRDLLVVTPSLETITIDSQVIRFEDVSEIVYAMVRYPISSQENALHVQAFTVLARVGENVLVPLIEASPDKNDVYLIARTLGAMMGHEVSFVGIGVQ